jgi:hypothetical protein
MYFHHYDQDVEWHGLSLATIFSSQERGKLLSTLIGQKFDIDKFLNV